MFFSQTILIELIISVNEMQSRIMNYFIINKFVKHERPMVPVLDKVKGSEKIFSDPWGSVVLSVCRSGKFLEERWLIKISRSYDVGNCFLDSALNRRLTK